MEAVKIKSMPGNKVCNCRRGIIIGLAFFGVIAGLAVWFLLSAAFPNSAKVQAGGTKMKNFKEAAYGFSMDYPASWSLDVSYDLYAKGLMNADLANKKCGSAAKACNADCIDIRILVGKKPSGQGAPGLLVQLYEDFLMTKDFANASLVSAFDSNAKKVFKIASDAPTLALNGVCPGPLYVFENKDGDFVYVFAGFGAGAAAGGEEAVKQIISTINVGR